MNLEAKVTLPVPTFEEETRLWAAGFKHVAGVDEAGRGALAGPVVAAAVIVPAAASLDGVWAAVRDSKLLRPAAREALIEPIQQSALAWAVGIVPAQRIDEIGIAAATRQAMLQAVGGLSISADHLLIDWVKLPQCALPQICVPKADARIVSVAAASILAKVTRDRLLVEMAAKHPYYSFETHKGYGTAQHLAALTEHGPCVEHRHSFAPIAQRTTLWDAANGDANGDRP